MIFFIKRKIAVSTYFITSIHVEVNETNLYTGIDYESRQSTAAITLVPLWTSMNAHYSMSFWKTEMKYNYFAEHDSML